MLPFNILFIRFHHSDAVLLFAGQFLIWLKADYIGFPDEKQN